MLLSLVYLFLPQALAEDFRPTYQFVPEQNWMNESKGLIKIGSAWHLFYQHNPTANVWGNLSWGHATSSDLIHWTHEPFTIPSNNGIESTWTKYAGIPIILAAQEAPYNDTRGLKTRDPRTWVSNLASSNFQGLPYSITGCEEASPASENRVLVLIGSFDRTTYTANSLHALTLWLDHGRDFDGAKTWENVPAANRRRILAAISNSYRLLLFPRQRFLQQPVTELMGVTGLPLALIQNQTLAPGQTLLTSVRGTALDIHLAFSVNADAILSLAIRVANLERTTMNRTASGDTRHNPAAGGVHNTPLRPQGSGVLRIQILVGTYSVEISGGQGEVVISDLIFPTETSNGVSLTATGGAVNLQTLGRL
ncbi:glycosyl hydrolase [Aspergillus pseudoustus]|uniref:Glycosyl hydrolase n=1 Tax=Aspergillus pseudoustus TaxID=1810923 RepID=A0ABR4KIK2_9EURO